MDAQRSEVTITFLPTLGVDFHGEALTTINNLLNATTQLLNINFAQPAGIQVDMWELIN
jgi:hypothetical protein